MLSAQAITDPTIYQIIADALTDRRTNGPQDSAIETVNLFRSLLSALFEHHFDIVPAQATPSSLDLTASLRGHTYGADSKDDAGIRGFFPTSYSAATTPLATYATDPMLNVDGSSEADPESPTVVRSRQQALANSRRDHKLCWLSGESAERRKHGFYVPALQGKMSTH